MKEDEIKQYATKLVDVTYNAGGTIFNTGAVHLIGEGIYDDGENVFIFFADSSLIYHLPGNQIQEIHNVATEPKHKLEDCILLTTSTLSTASYIKSFQLYHTDTEDNDTDKYPHICPYCKAPAYIGGNNVVDCSRGCK